MFTFIIKGITLNVIPDDGILENHGVPEWAPSAVVDAKAGEMTGTVRVTKGFLEMDKKFQEILLTHEAGHIACGHFAEDHPTDKIVENDRLEAEADAWAIQELGYEQYASVFTHVMGIILAKLEFPAFYKSMLEEETEQRLARAVAVVNK